MSRAIISAFEAEFGRYRRLAESAGAQVPWETLRVALDASTNSVAVTMKHVAGNLRSRWTDPFTSDGEKPWRGRDGEFVDDFADRGELDRMWSAGWAALGAALASFSDADLERSLTIRGEPHTLALAFTRSLAHTAYHCGQIVQVARLMAARGGLPWRTLTVPRGGSEEHNKSVGFDPERADRAR